MSTTESGQEALDFDPENEVKGSGRSNTLTRGSPEAGTAPSGRRQTRGEVITCGGCTHTWTATGAAHCSACHTAPFSTARLFDAHRHTRGEDGGCTPPETIKNKRGERTHILRGGMWRGPELSDEQKAAAFGSRS